MDKDTDKASDKQVGGNHYKDFQIQPYEFFVKNNLPFHKADIIKRIVRYDLPGGKGLEDLEKIKHEVDLIIEFQELERKREMKRFVDLVSTTMPDACRYINFPKRML